MRPGTVIDSRGVAWNVPLPTVSLSYPASEGDERRGRLVALRARIHGTPRWRVAMCIGGSLLVVIIAFPLLVAYLFVMGQSPPTSVMMMLGGWLVLTMVGLWWSVGPGAGVTQNRLIKEVRQVGLCPCCGYELRDLEAAGDGCTVCPECGAGWRMTAERGGA